MSDVVPSLGCLFWGHWRQEHANQIILPMWDQYEPMGGLIHDAAQWQDYGTAKIWHINRYPIELLQKLLPTLTYHDLLDVAHEPYDNPPELTAQNVRAGNLFVFSRHPVEQQLRHALLQQLFKVHPCSQGTQKIFVTGYYSDFHEDIGMLQSFRSLLMIPLFIVDAEITNDTPLFFTRNHSWPMPAEIPKPWISAYKNLHKKYTWYERLWMKFHPQSHLLTLGR